MGAGIVHHGTTFHKTHCGGVRCINRLQHTIEPPLYVFQQRDGGIDGAELPLFLFGNLE